MSVYVVIWEDRHDDDNISVHKTRQCADARLEEHMLTSVKRYGRDITWDHDCPDGWVRAVRDEHDDGPNGRIELKSLED